MTTVSGALNNLLETAATPQQRPRNALVTTFKGRTPETFYDIDRTRSTKWSKVDKIPTGVKIDHTGQSI